MSDPFRDPLDGAVRRAERLEEQNRELRREVERLRRGREAQPPSSPPAPKSPSTTRMALGVTGGAFLLLSSLLKLVSIGHQTTYTPPPWPKSQGSLSPAAPAHDERSPTVFYSKATSPTESDLRGAAPMAPVRVAVGAQGAVVVGDRVEAAPTKVTLHAVAVTTSATKGTSSAIAVGNGGTILRRKDLAGEWVREDSGTSVALQGIASAGESTWVVGAGGVVLQQSAPGKRWRVESSGTTRDLEAVTRARSELVAVGKRGTVVQTALDGSGSWKTVNVPTTADLHAVYSDGVDVWVAGDAGTLLRRTATNEWRKIPLRTEESLRSVTVLSKLGSPIVVAVGDHGSVVVGEGGRWFEEYAYADDLLAIGRADDRAFAVGRNGAIVDLKLY